EDRRRKRDERQEGERGGPTCPEPAREREDRSERPEADEELEEAGDPQPAEEKPEGEEVLLVVPQEALRREAGERRDGPVEREVARLREVIGQSVEREVGRQGADPRRGEEEKSHGEPRRFERARALAPRNTKGPCRDPREDGNPPPPDRGEQSGEEKQRRPPPEPDLSEEEGRQPEEHDPGAEGRGEAGGPGVPAAADPGYRAPRDERHREDGRRREERGKVSGEKDEEERAGGAEGGGDLRVPEDSPGQSGQSGRRREDAGRDPAGAAARPQLVHVDARQRNGSEEDRGGEDDEQKGDAAGARPGGTLPSCRGHAVSLEHSRAKL